MSVPIGSPGNFRIPSSVKIRLSPFFILFRTLSAVSGLGMIERPPKEGPQSTALTFQLGHKI